MPEKKCGNCHYGRRGPTHERYCYLNPPVVVLRVEDGKQSSAHWQHPLVKNDDFCSHWSKAFREAGKQ